VSRIELAPEVGDDFDRILDHLAAQGADDALSRMDSIMQAIEVLHANPLIGRPVGNDLRELVIGRGGAGYIALYCHVSAIDTVFVLSLRSQREAGYHGP
jgi:toxin ParE1/3/4